MVSRLYGNNRVCKWFCDALQCLVMRQPSAHGHAVTARAGKQAGKQARQAGRQRKVTTSKASMHLVFSAANRQTCEKRHY